MATIREALAMFAEVRNPLPAILDRMGLQRGPYVLKLRNGTEVELRPRTGDLFGFYEVMLRKDYMVGGQRLVAGATVIDVGANVGCFTLLAAQLVGSAGRVFAVEPEPTTYKQLLRNIELNQLTNVTPLQAAVGGERGKVTLHSDPIALFSSMFGSVNGRQIEGTDYEVEMTTLRAIIEGQGIPQCDYLKLDCEGAEHDIVANLSATTAERITQITLEVHKIPGCDGDILQSRLEQLGYRLVATSGLPFYVRAAGAPFPAVDVPGAFRADEPTLSINISR